ncbi:MAG: DUF4258 domain-containing protein [Bacteroidales bacterium]|nr:DUF4258 domain-containing protein [Bacteroidales bacterium]
MKYLFSQHATEQMNLRGISREIVVGILNSPDETIEVDNLLIFQSIVKDVQEPRFLIRVFVNMTKIPPLVVTVYKTSKIEKYYENKI